MHGIVGQPWGVKVAQNSFYMASIALPIKDAAVSQLISYGFIQSSFPLAHYTIPQ